MLRENHAVLGGKNIDFRGGGGINIHFRPKYRPLAYSKEKPLLALFISTSNEHILDKRMVKICGLTICLMRMSVQ